MFGHPDASHKQVVAAALHEVLQAWRLRRQNSSGSTHDEKDTSSDKGKGFGLTATRSAASANAEGRIRYWSIATGQKLRGSARRIRNPKGPDPQSRPQNIAQSIPNPKIHAVRVMSESRATRTRLLPNNRNSDLQYVSDGSSAATFKQVLI